MVEEHKTKVMMLDDEGFLVQLYKSKFEKNGCEVADYYSADEALAALRKGYQPDVILFDITMPGSMSGYEFLEHVQKERLSKRALKLALTNEGQDAEIARTGELGADAHLIKAKYIPSELVDEVSKLLKDKNEKRGILGRIWKRA